MVWEIYIKFLDWEMLRLPLDPLSGGSAVLLLKNHALNPRPSTLPMLKVPNLQVQSLEALQNTRTIWVVVKIMSGLYWGIMEKKMETTIMGYIGIIGYMGACQNYGPFLGTLNIRGHIILGTQKGTIILTTSHM